MGPVCEGLAWYREGAKYGFVNENGDVVVPAQYDEGSDFHEGRALARRGSLCGFIDPTGAEVIPVQFHFASPFTSGRSLVKRVDGTCWLVDRDGAAIRRTACQFDDSTYCFFSGRARVKRAGAWGYVDLEGEEVVPCVYDRVADAFHRDRAAVCRGALWGYVDPQGREVIACQYGYVEPFTPDGYACVRLASGAGIVDTNGREIVPCRYESVGRVREARVVVDEGSIRDEDESYGRVGCLDVEGREILACRHERIEDFAGGRARVTVKTGPGRIRTYFVDREGRELPDEA